MPRNTLVATKRHALTPGDPSGIPETHKGGIKSKLKGPRPEAAIESKKAEMADVRGGCDAGCGCPVPCPGGVDCKCSTTGASAADHSTCPCGEHCGCNPCTCPRGEVTGIGKLYCKCADGCTCVKCTA